MGEPLLVIMHILSPPREREKDQEGDTPNINRAHTWGEGGRERRQEPFVLYPSTSLELFTLSMYS